MAAYTELRGADIEALTAAFDVPPAVAWKPTAEGIENTNYFVTTREPCGKEREWVLTRIEQSDTPAEEVATWLEHLHAGGLPVPAPAALRRPAPGARFTTRHEGQPVVLFQRLPGGHPERFEPWMCAAAGTFLARLHRAGTPPGILTRAHVRDLSWLERKAARLRPTLSAPRRALLDGALARQRDVEQRADWGQLPRGVVHGDLFHDNALFDDGRLTGVIDFYHASRECLIFDLAVVLNDWCIEPGPTGGAARLREAHALALLAAYHGERPLDTWELAFLPLACERSALRFWLARALPDVGDAPRKDPDEMARVLELVATVVRFPDSRWLEALGGGSEATPGAVAELVRALRPEARIC